MYRKSSGFTLIELMIVIAVIAITLSIGTPLVVQYLNQQGLGRAVEQIRGDMQMARMMAINQRAQCNLQFNTPAINQYTNAMTNQQVNLANFRGGVTFINPGPDGVAFSPTVFFTSRGQAGVNGRIFITSVQNNAIYRLRTTAAGGISVHRWVGGNWVRD